MKQQKPVELQDISQYQVLQCTMNRGLYAKWKSWVIRANMPLNKVFEWESSVKYIVIFTKFR